MVESCKFLGIIIDSQLLWSDHIQYLRTKISKGICKARKSHQH